MELYILPLGNCCCNYEVIAPGVADGKRIHIPVPAYLIRLDDWSLALVDTGMHSLGWSREQAIAYMSENTGLSGDLVVAEVDRYIVWPGQALGYKIGELKIQELRARAAKALGAKFDLRKFHNALIDDGPLPLDVLEQRIDEWIKRQQ